MAFTKPAMLAYITPRLLRTYLVVSIGAINFGYDNNWWSGAIAADSFIQHYGKNNGPGRPRTLPSNWLSIASGTPVAGWIVGCFVAPYVTRGLGRKMAIVIVCIIAIIGMIMQCAIDSYWGIMAGRLVNAISMGIEANCVPMYMTELAPASVRGGLVNFYQSWLYIGAIVASATVYGSTTTLGGKWAYLTPIVVQLAPPVMLLASIWTVPESPRWLLQKGRHAQALDSLMKMREGVSTDSEVEMELDLITQAMEAEMETHRATTFADCFKGVNARRTLVAVSVQCLQQAQGNSFTQQYSVIFLKQVGVGNPQLISVAMHCCSFGGTLLTFYLSDKVGRRPMLMGGSLLMALFMWTVTGLASFNEGGISGSTAKGAIAALCLYGAVAAACWGSVMWAVTAEVGTTQLRERTISIATICGFLTSIIITYINPFVQNEPVNLGSKIGMIYGGVSVFAFLYTFLVVPEMRGRSLEELDDMFRTRVPAWKSQSFVSTGIGAQISSIEGHDPEGVVAKLTDHQKDRPDSGAPPA